MSFPRLVLLLAALCAGVVPSSRAEIGETQILKWKDGRKACFLLGFDDSAGSQLKNVVPELDRRRIVGTFYLVTGNGVYNSLKARWEEAAKSPYVVVANHTFTHKGVVNPEELELELAKCNEVLYALHPERKPPYLLAWGRPGGVPWVVTPEEQRAALERHHLLERPPFAGPPINYKSAEAVVAVVDRALAKGEMEQLVFHGVGGDWLVTPVEWFTALLDKLEQHRDEIWITDAASWKKYVTERDTAEAKLLESGKDRIRIALNAKVEPALYDEPLTLSTKVPATWSKCLVEQGGKKTGVSVENSAVRFDALPNGGEILIHPAP